MDCNNEENMPHLQNFLKYNEPNFLESIERKFTLPHCPRSNQIVECFLFGEGGYQIKALDNPIRYGKNWGNVIWIYAGRSCCGGNPKFVFDPLNKCWVLFSHGLVLFAEQEIDPKNERYF